MSKLWEFWRAFRGKSTRPIEDDTGIDLAEEELKKEHDDRLKRIGDQREGVIDDAIRALERELDIRYGYHHDDKRTSH